MILAVTGHRPQKLGGFSSEAIQRVKRFARLQLERLRPCRVLTGMALGWDLAIAAACYDLSIPFTACIPCDGQESRWNPGQRQEYWIAMRRAAAIVNAPGGEYAAWKMQKRNEYMVDNCEVLLALYDGSTGGTANCVKYAGKVRREVVNCWEDWRTK
jgi:uncharacterized phage-like protein YoqJ